MILFLITTENAQQYVGVIIWPYWSPGIAGGLWRREETAKLLLPKGTYPTGTLSKCTFSEATFRLLLERGVDMALDDSKLALRSATCYRQVATVRTLLKKRAKLNSISNVLKLRVPVGPVMVKFHFQRGVIVFLSDCSEGRNAVRHAVNTRDASLSFSSRADAVFLEMAISLVFLQSYPRKILKVCSTYYGATVWISMPRTAQIYTTYCLASIIMDLMSSVFKLFLETDADPLHQ